MLESAPKWGVLQTLPVALTVRIPLRGVVLRRLAELTVGTILSSDWAESEEVPLYAQNVALGWCEFEIVEGSIAVRLTRLT